MDMTIALKSLNEMQQTARQLDAMNFICFDDEIMSLLLQPTL